MSTLSCLFGESDERGMSCLNKEEKDDDDGAITDIGEDCKWIRVLGRSVSVRDVSSLKQNDLSVWCRLAQTSPAQDTRRGTFSSNPEDSALPQFLFWQPHGFPFFFPLVSKEVGHLAKSYSCSSDRGSAHWAVLLLQCILWTPRASRKVTAPSRFLPWLSEVLFNTCVYVQCQEERRKPFSGLN